MSCIRYDSQILSCYDGASHVGLPAMLQAASPVHSFRFGLFEADVSQKALTRNGVRVKIQDQPFRVLMLLLESPGEIVSRETLRQHLWPDGTFVDFDGSLNVILKKLRAAIDDNPDNPRFIETVPRRGYRFIAPVTVVREEVQPVIVPSPSAAPPTEKSVGESPVWRRYGKSRVVAYCAAAVLLFAAGVTIWTRWSDRKNAAVASTTASSPVHLRRSVAVLGFHNLSGIESDKWLGTALAEMLSTELASGDKLRMVSAEDVANLRAYSPWTEADTLDQATTSRIGKALSSDLLVLGSFTILGRPDHGRLRVDVRLQDCRSGEVITEIAEIGATEDLFGIVSRTGSKLRSRIGVPRTGESDELMVQASLPSNPDAARFYALGLEKLRALDFEVARGLFEQAAAAEPRFSLAHAMLSRTDLFLGHFDQAKLEAKKGLDLSSGLPRVQRMEIEASYDQAIGERGKAADIYRVLFNLFPDSLDFGLQLAKLQLDSYHPDEARETIRQLRQLPSPASDDPMIDLRAAPIVQRKSADAAANLYRSAATKALTQGKKQVYAKAEQSLCYLNPQHVQSPPECQVAYDIFAAAGIRDLAGSTLQIMAEHQRLSGHELEAIPLYQQAMKAMQEAGDYEGVGVALNNLSLILENQGKWSQAEEEYRKAKQNFASVNDRVNLAVADGNLGDIETNRGSFQSADSLYRESSEYAEAAKPALDLYGHIGRAGLMVIRGELNQAVTELNPQISALQAWGENQWELADAFGGLADIQRMQGDLKGAQQSYEKAMQAFAKVKFSTASEQAALAQLAIDRGQPEEAERQIRDVIASFEKDKNAGEELGGYVILCKALLAQGKTAETRTAIEHAKKLADLHEFPVLGMPLELLDLRVRIAEAPRGNAGRATLLEIKRKLRDVLQRAHRIGFYTEECEIRLALGEVELKISPGTANADLSTFASEARNRGFTLYADQATRISSRGVETVASNRP